MQHSPYRGHRFPPEIICHAVWLYLRFTLSFRDVEELLAERGLDISYETIRRWVLKFGPQFARELRRRRTRPSSVWHLDEMVIRIGGERFWLWRALDSEGEVLDILVQRRRDAQAAVKLMRKLLKKQGFAPDVIVTDKLASYACARRKLRLGASHEQGLRANNRAENASAGPAPRAQDAAFQVGGIRVALPGNALGPESYWIKSDGCIQPGFPTGLRRATLGHAPRCHRRPHRRRSPPPGGDRR